MATKTRPSRREADRTRPAKSSYLMTWEELQSYTGRLGNIHVSEVGSGCAGCRGTLLRGLQSQRVDSAEDPSLQATSTQCDGVVESSPFGVG